MDKDPAQIIREKRGVESGSGGPASGTPTTPMGPWAPQHGGQQQPGDTPPDEPPVVPDSPGSPPDRSWQGKLWDDEWGGHDSWDETTWVDEGRRIESPGLDGGDEPGRSTPLVDDPSTKGEPESPPVEPKGESSPAHASERDVPLGESRELPERSGSPLGDSWQEGPWERGFRGERLDPVGGEVPRGELRELPERSGSPLGDSWQEGPWERGIRGERLGSDGGGPPDPPTPPIDDPSPKGEAGLPPVEPRTEFPGERGGLEPGEILLRKVTHDPDGNGPLAPEVSYEAVRVLPDGAKGGELLRPGDMVLRDVVNADPDGEGPLEPTRRTEVFEVGPEGLPGQRVEKIPLEDAPPHIRELALFSDPDGDGPMAPYARARAIEEPSPPGGDRLLRQVQNPQGRGGPMQAPPSANPGNGTHAPPEDEDSGNGGRDGGSDRDPEQGKDDGGEPGDGDGNDGSGGNQGQDRGKGEGEGGGEGQDGKGEGKGGGEGQDGKGGGNQGGNVSPDPNLKFDEAAYNQLLNAVHSVRLSLLQDAVVTPGMRLDDEWEIVPPGNTNWGPGDNLYKHGQEFGQSVKDQNEKLRERLSKFEVAMISGKEVFKETDDLAAYSAGVFTSEYPDFGLGPSA